LEKYGFVYIWRDRKHKRYYIGCHWGTVDDGYICSSSWMKQAYKHRPEDFKRRILKTNISREDLLSEEFKWLSLIKPEELKIKYYNLNIHHFGHWTNDPNKLLTIKENISKKQIGRKQSEETKRKRSEILRGKPGRKWTEEQKQAKSLEKLGKKRNGSPEKWKHSEETKEKISKANSGKPSSMLGKFHTTDTKDKLSIKLKGREGRFKGHIHSKEAKEKISKANNGKKHSDETKIKMSETHSGINNHFFGKFHSDETKTMISKKLKGTKIGNKNPAFGKKWYNNGIECKLLNECPEDWVKGRIN
jgi:hypothetical protein